MPLLIRKLPNFLKADISALNLNYEDHGQCTGLKLNCGSTFALCHNPFEICHFTTDSRPS